MNIHAPWCAEPTIRPRLVLCVVGGYTDCHTTAFWAEMAGMGALMYPREHPRGIWVACVASPPCGLEVTS